jgi:hypothetical protein
MDMSGKPITFTVSPSAGLRQNGENAEVYCNVCHAIQTFSMETTPVVTIARAVARHLTLACLAELGATVWPELDIEAGL